MSKSKKKVVKGPQLALPGAARTLKLRRGAKRNRYLEPPAGPDGNAFVAFRAPAELFRKFKAAAKAKAPKVTVARSTPWAQLLKVYMAKVSGVALSEVAGDDD